MAKCVKNGYIPPCWRRCQQTRGSCCAFRKHQRWDRRADTGLRRPGRIRRPWLGRKVRIPVGIGWCGSWWRQSGIGCVGTCSFRRCRWFLWSSHRTWEQSTFKYIYLFNLVYMYEYYYLIKNIYACNNATIYIDVYPWFVSATSTEHGGVGASAGLSDDESDCVDDESMPYDDFLDVLTFLELKAVVFGALRTIWSVLLDHVLLQIIICNNIINIINIISIFIYIYI